MPNQDNQISFNNKKRSLIKWMLYILPLVIGLVYWLAFFPGVMSYDSLYQWDQLSTLKISSWHPAIHTILMWILTRIWYSPAIVSLFQVVFASIIIGYGLNSILAASSLPAYLFVALGILMAGNPLVGIIDITLWKDIIYSFLVLLLTIIIFNILSTKGQWINKPIHFILLGCTAAFICLFRYNGFPIAVTSLVCLLLIYIKNYKPFIYSSLIFLSVTFLVLGPLYTIFKVDREYRQPFSIALLNPVVAYVSADKDLSILSSAEKSYLNSIYPLDAPWPYSCYDATIFFYQQTNLHPLIDDSLSLIRIISKLAIKDPLPLIHHFACLSSFVWQPNQPRNVYLETILLDTYNPAQTPAWLVYSDVVIQKPLLPQINHFIQRLVQAEWHRDTAMLLWRPALYMYAFMLGLILYVVRSRNSKWLILSVPLLTQSMVLMFTAQLQAVRYQYPVYLISMLFTIPLVIVGIKYQHPFSIQVQ